MKVYVLTYAHSPKEEPLNVETYVFASYADAKLKKKKMIESFLKNEEDYWGVNDEYDFYCWLYDEKHNEEAVIQIDEHEI